LEFIVAEVVDLGGSSITAIIDRGYKTLLNP
jgi:hypothetical protein